ncbi:MAG TPA: class I SAM-dependent methyltransferase [Williamwhitmania sp.]|nr:class I SAM-dependent methyltransferase [Williamwhitmania sp.]
MDIVRQKDEIGAFKNLWHGGFREGDPLDTMGISTYGPFGYMSCLYATYLCCIKPYITKESNVLEIGPGRGAWTKCFITRGAKEIWAIDALSAEHNGFWDYVGVHENVRYFQVEDNTCSMVPDESIDYFFSFGCFCHLSPNAINDYMTYAYKKMRPGSHGFFMFADYDKYNSLIENESKYSISRMFETKRFIPILLAWRIVFSIFKSNKLQFQNKNEDDIITPGRWYHLGVDNAENMLKKIGFEVIEKDVGVIQRDPIVHFFKPLGSSSK